MEGGDLCPDCFQPRQRQTPCRGAKVLFWAKPTLPAAFCVEMRAKPVGNERCGRIWGGRGVSHSSSKHPSPCHGLSTTENTGREIPRGMGRLLVTSRAQSPARDGGSSAEAAAVMVCDSSCLSLGSDTFQQIQKWGWESQEPAELRELLCPQHLC